MNQASDLTAIRPTAPPLAPRLEIPETMVANTSGAMIILIIRRKMSDTMAK
jgi:hypothetical protein